jgi:hypothetical protein
MGVPLADYSHIRRWHDDGLLQLAAFRDPWPARWRGYTPPSIARRLSSSARRPSTSRGLGLFWSAGGKT